jgi:ribosomal protein S18 acetylase RimI-like enzyme
LAPVIRPLTADDGPWKEALLRRAWGGVAIARKGELVEVLPLEGFVAVLDGERCGLLTYLLRGDELEIVTLQVEEEGKGLARALMDATWAQAEVLGARRLWLTTTDNNARAVRFYQRWGLRLVACYPDGVSRSRLVKPSIPLVDGDGVPIRDELEFGLVLAVDRTIP